MPAAGDNPLGAWACRGSLPGSQTGPLAGKCLAVKDTVLVQGWPLLNGTAYLRGYVPELDSTVVTRILEAGGTLVGKSVCEYLCLSGGSHTAASGPVSNPARAGHSAGGSSSGSAALVAAGAVDMALGGDQGGSVRIPASWCGCVGLKPTFGLVPYTGVVPIEPTLDHVGPLASCVADCAALLDAVAGRDGLDPRQDGAPERRDVLAGDGGAPDGRGALYTASLRRGVAGLRVGVLAEGFGQPGADPEVEAKVRAAAALLASLGAVVTEASVPAHRDGPAVWAAIALEGLVVTMLQGRGAGHGTRALYPPCLIAAHGSAHGWRSDADAFTPSLKACALEGELLRTAGGGLHHAAGQNARRPLGNAYDAVLRDVDLLLLPTTPMAAQPLPPADASPAESLARSLESTCGTRGAGMLSFMAVSPSDSEHGGLADLFH